MAKVCSGCAKVLSSLGLFGDDESEELSSLNAQFDAISAWPEATLRAEQGSMGVVVVLRAGEASARVSLFGAHLLSWIDSGGEERLWMSSIATLDGSAPIRGGVPIAWPQFANQGQLPLHGFARTSAWAVDTAGSSATLRSTDGSAGPEVRLSLTMRDSEATRASAWGVHAFQLTYTITLCAASLHLGLRVTNTGAAPFSWTGCLHTYLRAADATAVRVRGLKGLRFTDKVADMRQQQEEDEALSVEAAAAHSGGFVDRIYHREAGGGARHDPVLHWDEAGRAAALTVEQSGTWTDTVVFNPFGDKARSMSDFDDNGPRVMLCLEPAVAQAELLLQPECAWDGWQKITVNQGEMTTADL